MKLSNWVLPLMLLFVASCETFLEVEIPDNEPRLVINALLEPSRPVFVHVSRSSSILEDGEFAVIQDAAVTVTDEEGRIHALEFVKPNEWAPDYGYYTTEALNPLPGMAYTIETAKTGFKTASSKTTIPLAPQIKAFSFRKLPSNQSRDIYNPHAEMEFTLVFDDPAGENFYEIELYYEGIGTASDYEGNPYETTYGQFAYLVSKNPAYEQDYRNDPGIIINDRLFDQQEASINFHTYIPENARLKMKVYLREITREAFRYDMSYNLQRSNRGDPLSQPVQVFSNIQNGFGILGARNSTYLEDSIFIAKQVIPPG